MNAHYTLEWPGLYRGDELKKYFSRFMNFSIFYTGYLYAQIFKIDGSLKQDIRMPFLRNSVVRFDDLGILEKLREFCMDFMGWCVDIAESISVDIERTKLFDVGYLKRHVNAMQSPSYKHSESYYDDTFVKNAKKLRIIYSGDEILYKKFRVLTRTG
jgi:hypothetical protein